MKILLVDDDKIIRIGLAKMIKRIFEDNHEVVFNFQNGLVAFDYIKENKVDLVITDIKMPVMTGSELIEKAVNELENPPMFIVLSGYDEFTYVRDTMKLGAFNYLLKPLKQDDLKKVIEEAELKLKENSKQEKMINKSIDIVRKDFFKNILFSTSDNLKINKSLLENIQMDENKIYKLLILDGNKNIKNEKELILNLLKNIKEKVLNINYLTFNTEEKFYILFYFDSTKEDVNKNLCKALNEESKVFLSKGLNVYIFKETMDINKLREQSKRFKIIHKNIIDEKEQKIYNLSLKKELSDDLEKNTQTNLTAIKLAKEYIIKNFNKNITLKAVAAAVFLSQNYLSALFKKELNEGFYDFLSNYRINVSKQLLLTTNLKVYEIAERVGYNDSITFGRAFKKITGTTPNGFRNGTND
ncbi:MAG: response regulator [Clostridium sp.]